MSMQGGWPDQNAPGPSQYRFANPGMIAARAATAALSNPYGQPFAHFGYQQVPHCAQYRPYGSPSVPCANSDGYTLSSTYVPGSYNGAGNTTSDLPQRSNQRHAHHGPVPTHWYQPGNTRCTHVGCKFVGSKKAVEIHMMDRHLIFPPGWENRKRKSDWDADPSLKGKPIPIQGTTIKLNTPEAIAEWIAERKKRFPTSSRVEEKAKKMEEAIARGQLPPIDSRFPNRKRRRLNDSYEQTRGRGRGRGRGQGRGRVTEQELWTRDDGETATRRTHEPIPLPARPSFSVGSSPSSTAKPSGKVSSLPNVAADYASESSDADTDSDSAPEIVSSKAPLASLESEPAQADEVSSTAGGPQKSASANVARGADASTTQQVKPIKKPYVKHPRKPLNNPFASRPSLLRNLLTPEIRMTVSNLSQAIRFLVDNDFLEDVELRAGQASEKMIEVIGSSTAADADNSAVASS
ncbi:uncharacterized protein LAESUDRAFT_813190 [Laetiporus sulphureus 93-53]|uniref:FMR1-interacting protein 1 conserved domain-containing protein n=1 Tax=Laetiporus sulphureus 93-53 TaxID=1314785 RepID=A0A165DZJ6_9APHY|nr:uncharacterized protein LAESUDRAFT_813190 [Laetiporus sulphureus 93-53]KZT05961.1 hypothetical protein LAESUDRAFT_813190 [Laetiporus sulphureus 93-53]